MNTKEQILNMVKDGTISVEEGVELLSALDSKSETVTAPVQTKLNSKRMLRVDVDSKKGEKVKINVPLALAKLGIDLGTKMDINGSKLNMKGIDLDAIIDQIDENTHGELLTVDSEDGDHVRIFID